MSSEIESVVGEGEYYAKSEEGLWVRSVLDYAIGQIRFEWQMRHRMSGGLVESIDCNGDVIDRTPLSEVAWSDPWVEAGNVSMDSGELIGMVPISDLFKLQRGIMVHGSKLIALGWGTDAAEVVSWFENPWEGEFILMESEYVVRDGVGAFVDLDVAVV
ncbi:MAG: hypothetical protein KAJ19_12380, partial [Gammaproteobacteria bacterium]|nr:hypothetical protein [Gammaproteobacteria bacterium]